MEFPTSLAIAFVVLGIITAVGNCYQWNWYDEWTGKMWSRLTGEDNRCALGLLYSYLALFVGLMFLLKNSLALHIIVAGLFGLIGSVIIVGMIYSLSKSTFIQSVINRSRNND